MSDLIRPSHKVWGGEVGCKTKRGAAKKAALLSTCSHTIPERKTPKGETIVARNLPKLHSLDVIYRRTYLFVHTCSLQSQSRGLHVTEYCTTLLMPFTYSIFWPIQPGSISLQIQHVMLGSPHFLQHLLHFLPRECSKSHLGHCPTLEQIQPLIDQWQTMDIEFGYGVDPIQNVRG